MESDRVLVYAVRKLIGSANVPTVVPFGSPFVQGANGAAIIAATLGGPALVSAASVDFVRRGGDTDGQASYPIGTSDAELGLSVVPRSLLFDGAVWDRVRAASAPNVAATNGRGVALSAPPGEWTVFADPALATQATATRIAAGPQARNVCRSITATLAAGAAAAGPLKVYLRDGAAGVGAILWAASLSAPVQGVGAIAISGLSIVGSINTAMTLEFAAAGPAGSQENVTLTGYMAPV